jgi:AraC family transcriptional regulator, transcriptional activator of pobA
MLSCNCNEIPIFNIRDFGETVKSVDFDFARLENRMNNLPYPHRHDFFHIVWVTHGTGTHTIDSEIYMVKPDTMFFMRPGQIHDFDLSDDATGYTINFSSEFFLLNMSSEIVVDSIPFFRPHNPIGSLSLTSTIAQSLQLIISSIEKEYRQELFCYHDIIRSYLHILFNLAARSLNKNGGKNYISSHILLDRRFRKLLEEGPIYLTNPSNYARALGVTERRLTQATKTAQGMTATEAIHNRLALEAKRLLAHSELNIATVAMRLGFEDPAYFSRFFKKRCRVTPSEFKKKLQGA